MSGNWLKVSAIGLCLALFPPAIVAAQEESLSRSTTATLDTVVVTASRAEEKLREVTTNVTVITEKQIQNSTANNLADLLKQQGFLVSGIYSNADARVQIRGISDDAGNPGSSTENRVQVLINGRKTGITNIAPVGLNNIERVEIIRGPAAVQYGSSAIGGVVNIITKRGKEGEFWAAAETGVGSFDLYKNSLGFGGAANNIDFSTGITHLKRGDDFGRNADSTETFNTLGGDTTMNFDLGYTLFEKHRLGLNFNHYKIKDSESHSVYSWGSYESVADLQNDNLGFSYEGATYDDRFNWSAVYSFGKDQYKLISGYGPSAADQNIEAFAGQAGYNGQMISANLGLDYNFADVKSPSLNENSEASDLGIFFSGRLRLLDESLIFSAGGRYDSFERKALDTGSNFDDTNFSPSVGMAYLPLDWLKLRANYSEGFLAPSVRQYGGFDGQSMPYLANPDLKPEKNKTFELGADINWTNALNASLTYFNANWDNKIISEIDPMWAWMRHINIKKATIAGLEFSINSDIGQMLDQSFELRPYLNLTLYTSRKNKDDENFIALDPSLLPRTPEYTLNYGVTFNDPGYDLMANINATYVGKMLINNTDGYHTPGTVSVDLSLEKGIWDFNDRNKLKLRAEVNNLFNNDNMVVLNYPGPERNFYVGLKYEFN